ncbi:gag-pol polyprotein [Cucumis melo var. makuwa]|uniref:Gag-pol polyprotein n=1 Tax=Cucumis melo var. makuwa TaxID=1194695 RepID=A0A5D3CIT0_CUCMM|nr:gag-pol polyprotein [Cucumis melo var. makuwa]TYK11260.1 gag-pol polyprotein [Cucumis melo var. makuwa]
MVGNLKMKISITSNNRAYRVFNNRSRTIMETINVVVNDSESTAKQTNDEDDKALKVTMVSPTALTEAPKADTQADSADI